MSARYADTARLEQFIRELAPAYGPSGHEEAVRALIRRHVTPLADEVLVDRLGSLIALIRGAGGTDARRIMIAAQAAMMAVSLALAASAWFGWLGPWLLLSFTFLIGVGTALHNPAWQASIGEDRKSVV